MNKPFRFFCLATFIVLILTVRRPRYAGLCPKHSTQLDSLGVCADCLDELYSAQARDSMFI